MNTRGDELQALMATFRKDGERVQWQAIEQLRAHAGEAIPVLRDALRSSGSAHTRAWSATALAVLEGKGAIPDLLDALLDAAMSVRLHAIQGLLSFNDAKLAGAIVPLISDRSGGVRVNAIDAMIRLDHAGAAEEIVARETDEKWYVRQHVARAIGKLSIATAVPVLRSLSNDPHQAVRNEATKALKSFEANTGVASNVPAR